MAALGIAAALAMLGAGIWLMRGEDAELTTDVAALGPSKLHAATKDSEEKAATPAHLPLVDARPSIVVMPFDNMSGDAEQEFFADGISEDLTTDLSKVPQLFVISRTSAFTYKGKSVDVKTVGRELGVRYLLEGSVRKVGTRVRVTAQLIDTTTEYHVWSERYDRDLSDIFAVQNEINSEILRALKITIDEAEAARIQSKPITNLNAYEAWHKGQSLIRDSTQEQIAEGRRLLERAIELEPNYGEAYAALANSYMLEFGGWNIDPALVAKAAEIAERGLELSPLSPLCYVSLAGVELGRFRPDKAIKLASRAIELAPSDYDAYMVRGVALFQMGRVADSQPSLEQAVRLNPKLVDLAFIALGGAYIQNGRVDDGIELLERVRTENPESIHTRLHLAEHYHAQGRSDLAKTLVKEILEVNPRYTTEQAISSLLLSGMPLGEEAATTRVFSSLGMP